MHHDLVVLKQAFGDRRFTPQFALSVPDGQFEMAKTFCEHAWRPGIDLQVDPLVPEISAVVVDQRHGTLLIIAVQSRQETNIDQGLKPIADTDDQFSRLNKVNDLIADVGPHANGLDDASTMVVAPAETTPKGQNLKIV